MSPLYLKSSEGKRLLAYMFGLHPSLVRDIHDVMKAQMPTAKRHVLAAYGEVSRMSPTGTINTFCSGRRYVTRLC